MSRVFENFLKNVPLSVFNGRPHENVQDWLSEISEYFDLVNATSVQRAQGAKVLLRENARAWVRQLPPCPEGTDAWEYFKLNLKARFENPNSKFFARSKLYSLKQTGSVTKYIAEFEKGRAILEDLSEPEAIQLFLNGLKPKIQEHFAGNPSLRTDLYSIMQIAESLDDVLFKNKQPHGGFVTRQTQQQVFPQPMELDAMVQRSNAARGPNQKQKQQDMANRTCFYCHQPNHQVRNCPSKQKDAGKAASQ
jgi:hypothetical protein